MSRKQLLSLFVVVGVLLIGLGLLGGTAGTASAQKAVPLAPIEQFGKALFFDATLSMNGDQSCASCHDPSVGWTGPDAAVNAHGAVYEGSNPGTFGDRKPPSAAYAGDSLPLRYDTTLGWVGGMFWDGRADGSVLGDPLAEQAKGPFLNPVEHGLTSATELCEKVAAAPYAGLYQQVFGAAIDCANAETVYDNIGRAIAAYERSAEVNPYSSKFDAFWDKAKNKRLDVTRISLTNYTKYRSLGLTDTELYGLAMFNDPNGANCASCHSIKPGSKGYPLFTDYTYDNLGIPKNPENPYYNTDPGYVDIGLGRTVGEASENGKHKVPTLRNVDKRPTATFVKAYGHNGAFKSLTDIVRFYAMSGMHGGMMGGGGMGGGGMGGGMCGGTTFGEPEVSENLAQLKMFRCRDVSYVVAFLKTLNDGYYTR